MKTLIRYIISGSIAVLTLLVSLMMMIEVLQVPEVFASNIAFCIAAMVNYLLQHNFVYNCEGKHTKHASRFIMVTLAGLLINYIIFSQLLTLIDLYVLVQILTILIVFVFSFIVNTMFTFRKERTV